MQHDMPCYGQPFARSEHAVTQMIPVPLLLYSTYAYLVCLTAPSMDSGASDDDVVHSIEVFDPRGQTIWLDIFARNLADPTAAVKKFCSLHFFSGVETCTKEIMREIAPALEPLRAIETPLLKLSVCGGLANQRLAIIQGLLIASSTGRLAVLPRLLADGTENVAEGYAPMNDSTVPFDAYFDRARTTTALAAMGIRVTDQHAHQSGNEPTIPTGVRTIAEYETLFGSAPSVMLECPRFAVDMRGARSAALRLQFWRIDRALVYADRIVSAADHVVAHIRKQSITLGGNGKFTALHLRVEPDWVAHCQVWGFEPDSGADPATSNCMTNTDQLDRVFAIERVPTTDPVFIATGGLNETTLSAAPHAVRGVGRIAGRYSLISKEAVLGKPATSMSRDVLAAIDAVVCQRAATFVGNSVSTFSALELLRRQQPNSPIAMGFHYNGGNIPLADALLNAATTPMEPSELLSPLTSTTQATNLAEEPNAYEAKHNCDVQTVPPMLPAPPHTRARNLKWVFTATSDGDRHFDDLVRRAVRSAMFNTNLVPVCVHFGPAGQLAQWLTSMGITVLHHNPVWKPQVLRGLRASHQKGRNTTSTNFAHVGAAITTFLRVDVPILGFTDEFVLYADTDVYFARDITLSDFLPLPHYFRVGTESIGGGHFTAGNAGVMLMNVEGLRRTHSQFLAMAFSSHYIEQGLHYGEAGPLDQGAYNKFYSGRFFVQNWPLFNWKPYWGYCAAAKIVHFHGPKPHDYLAHATGGPTRHSIFEPIFKRCSTLPVAHTCMDTVLRYYADTGGLDEDNGWAEKHIPPSLDKTATEPTEDHGKQIVITGNLGHQLPDAADAAA